MCPRPIPKDADFFRAAPVPVPYDGYVARLADITQGVARVPRSIAVCVKKPVPGSRSAAAAHKISDLVRSDLLCAGERRHGNEYSRDSKLTGGSRSGNAIRRVHIGESFRVRQALLRGEQGGNPRERHATLPPLLHLYWMP